MSERAQTDVLWIQSWSRDGASEFRIGRAGDELVAEWRGVAELRAHRSGASYEFRAAPHIDAEIVGKFHDNLVRALLGHLSGGLTLHAACVAGPQGAVAILGHGGEGKSTLAAAASLRPGVSLVGDDAAAIDLDRAPPHVSPTSRVSWLLPDACEALGVAVPDGGRATRKVPHPAARPADAPVPLLALVKLRWTDDERPSLRRLHGLASFEPISLAQVRFVLDEPEVQLRDFHQVAALAEQVPVYELSRRRRKDELRASVEVLASLWERSR